MPMGFPQPALKMWQQQLAGLLDAGDGWLRTKFTELGVIDFEHMTDIEEEYETFALTDDEVGV